jgi:hypothetical protein
VANDFSGDANCVALYKFDNDATDSIGGNDLTPVNTPTYDSGDKKEGTHSTDLEHDSTQYFTIADGDLDAGFPGKSGTSEQSFSICCWVKPESIPSGVWHAPVCKSNVASDIMSYAIVLQNDGKINLFIGYNGGADFDYLPFDTALSTGIWYHVAVTYDSSDNGMKIRIWDDNAGSLLDSNKTDTAAGDMSPDSAPLEIGRWDGSDTRTFDGKIDEVVIFKDVLTDDEIDEIRAGTYGTASAQAVGAGSIAIVGTLSHIPTFVELVGAGTVAIAGALAKIPTFIKAVGTGAVAITGALFKKLFVPAGSGAISITGSLNTTPTFLVVVGNGAIAIVGSFVAIPTFIASVGGGAISSAGGLIKKTLKPIGAGSSAVTGSLLKQTHKIVGSGATAITGALSTVPTFVAIVGNGAVAIEGSLTKLAAYLQTVGSASLGITGTLLKMTFKPVGSGATSMAGVLLKQTHKIVGSGSISISSSLIKQIHKLVGRGSVAITGSLIPRAIGLLINAYLHARSLTVKLFSRDLTTKLHERDIDTTIRREK